jgi:hypothetical protein
VNQTPFVIGENIEVLDDEPALVYSLDRLAAAKDGAFFQALKGKTVRMAISGARAFKPLPDAVAVPGIAGSNEVLYFFFFDGPVDLGPGDESLNSTPLWKASAKVYGDARQRTPEKHDDEQWIAQPRPDLLILSNRQPTLAEMFDPVLRRARNRALLPGLREWAHVDRTAPFWGIRHYSAASKTNARIASLPKPDASATGTTIRFDPESQHLEINYLSTNPIREGAGSMMDQFKLEEAAPGVWRLSAELKQKGPFPFHFAMAMLGYGGYR